MQDEGALGSFEGMLKERVTPPPLPVGGASGNIVCGPVLALTPSRGLGAAESRRKTFPVRDAADCHLPARNK